LFHVFLQGGKAIWLDTQPPTRFAGSLPPIRGQPLFPYQGGS